MGAALENACYRGQPSNAEVSKSLPLRSFIQKPAISRLFFLGSKKAKKSPTSGMAKSLKIGWP